MAVRARTRADRPDPSRARRPAASPPTRGRTKPSKLSPLSRFQQPPRSLGRAGTGATPVRAGGGGDAGGTAGEQPPHCPLEALLAFCVARSCFSATALGSSVFLGASSSPALPPQKGVPQGAFWPHFFLCLHANDQGISSKLMVLITVLAANNITINPTLMVSINRPSYLSSSPGISGCW